MLTGRKSGARREDKADVPWGFRMSNNGGNLHKKKRVKILEINRK